MFRTKIWTSMRSRCLDLVSKKQWVSVQRRTAENQTLRLSIRDTSLTSSKKEVRKSKADAQTRLPCKTWDPAWAARRTDSNWTTLRSHLELQSRSNTMLLKKKEHSLTTLLWTQEMHSWRIRMWRVWATLSCRPHQSTSNNWWWEMGVCCSKLREIEIFKIQFTI